MFVANTKTWFTSDLHFFHRNILKYCAESRPYQTVNEMNTAIVENWNSKISESDSVWILGDVSFGPVDPTVEILNQLKGKKYLIIGNHDKKLLKIQSFRDCFVAIDNYVEFRYNHTLVCMMHFPIESWNEKNSGSFMLHGHSHGNPIHTKGKILDVGVDTNKLMPYNLTDVCEILTQVPLVHDYGD